MSAKPPILYESIKHQMWVWRPADDVVVEHLKLHSDGDDILARLLASRGVMPDQVNDFQHPRLKNLMPDPDHLLGLPESVERMLRAIQHQEIIGILGDYDVDGACATGIMADFLEKVGGKVIVRIPDRIRDGYGPSVSIMEEFISQGASLVLTLDCGSMSFEALECAHQKGLDVIVMDHHGMSDQMPKAFAIINPKRRDQETELQILCAAGVVFMVLVGLARRLRALEFGEHLPDLMDYLDRVALATVCDIVPLRGLNRAFVQTGLRVCAQKPSLGLRVLQKVVGLPKIENAYHLGFILGPHINAGGRVGAADTGVRLLRAQSVDEAQVLAEQLVDLNIKRKDLEQKSLLQAQHQAHQRMEINDACMVVYEPSWHVGLIGILASRLKDQFQTPTVVLADCNGMVKGSARSMPGCDMGALFHEAVHLGILQYGGGHAMAGGCTLDKNRIEDFRHFLNTACAALHFRREYSVDGVLRPSGLSVEFCNRLKHLEPFGAENPEPTFLLENMNIRMCKIVGEKHLKLRLSDVWGNTVDAMCFQALGTAVGNFFLENNNRNIHCVGSVRINEWNQRQSVQFQIDDVALAG